MKIAVITDTHYGARKGADYIHSYFKKFYDNVFFPYLEKHNIDTIIHMGDMFCLLYTSPSPRDRG